MARGKEGYVLMRILEYNGSLRGVQPQLLESQLLESHAALLVGRHSAVSVPARLNRHARKDS